MIESVHFRNFKVLRDATLPLGRFTLIVGPNGTGKSTVLKAFGMAGFPGGYHYEQVASIGLNGTDTPKVEVNITWVDGNKTLVQWNPGNAGEGGFTGSHSNRDEKDRWIRGIRIYSLNSDAIARVMPLKPQAELLPDGSQLAIVLDRMRDQYPERFEILNEALLRWMPEFDRILFGTPEDGQRSFLLRTKNGHHGIPATELSQGTLLALAMLTLAYLPNPPSMVCIEEPDRGIHPRLLREVQDALYRLSFPENYGEQRDPVQVIATTHSPYLLDLYSDYPEDVVIAERTEQGSCFKRLAEHPHLSDILLDSHLGEIWYTGILGGVPA